MLRDLYGDDGNLGNRTATRDKTGSGTYGASKTFENCVTSRTELSNSFCFNMFFWIVIYLCCCFRTCCNRIQCMRKGTAKYHKFQLALERLSKE